MEYWWRTRRVIAVLVAATALSTACAAENPTVAPVDPCQRRVDAAALAIDLTETVELFDSAMGICNTLAAFETAMGQHPGVLGHSTLEVVARRCLHSEDPRTKETTMCKAAPVIALTGLPSFDNDIDTVYTGVALDGRAIELRNDVDITLDDGIPTDLVTIADVASQRDCEALIQLADTWRAEASLGGDGEGDVASVLTHAADVIAEHAGCTS